MTDLVTTDLDPNEPGSKRILVALDKSARGRAALKAAIRLALNTSAQLQGLFIEDENLVRLAALPFSREVDLDSAATQQLQSVNMELALQHAAEETRKAFADALNQFNLEWTFRVVKGNLVNVSLDAAGENDLLIIGQKGRTPRNIFGRASCERESESRVVTIFDGTPASYRAIRLADRLATVNAQSLSVFVLANNGGQIAQQCIAWLQQQGFSASVDLVLDPSDHAILNLARQWKPQVLLFNRDSKYIDVSKIDRLVNECDCPIVLC